jgi:hypothetical protein
MSGDLQKKLLMMKPPAQTENKTFARCQLTGMRNKNLKPSNTLSLFLKEPSRHCARSGARTTVIVETKQQKIRKEPKQRVKVITSSHSLTLVRATHLDESASALESVPSVHKAKFVKVPMSEHLTPCHKLVV